MLNAFPILNKRKSFDLCAAFLEGYPGPGQMITNGQPREGPAVFYGVDDSNIDAWNFARERGEYWYMDNSYVDVTRGTHFRVSKNRLQHSGEGRSDCSRLRAIGVDIHPWSQTGAHVVVCPQSDSFMRDLAGVSFDWTQKTTEALCNFTSRQIRVREWDRDKKSAARTLPDDLVGAHALVTWSSSAAVTAIISGVPVIVTGPSAARPMSGDIADVEDLPRPDREQWLGVLCDNQFTADELRSGWAWRWLNRE